MNDDFDAFLDHLVSGASRGGASSVEPQDFPVGLHLEPIEVVGRGGTGSVWRARDPVLDREVAVKIARADGGEVARRALLAEARLTARIQHPAVLPVHQVVAASGRLCVVFRLAPRVTLEVLLSDSQGQSPAAWPLERRLRLMLGAIEAVSVAHALGIVHGDLHPGNLAVGPSGEPYVLDWSGQPEAEGLSGTPGYAAPELLYGRTLTASSDVYALGALAWELVTLQSLRPRRRGEGLGAYVARWRDHEVVPPSEHVAVPQSVDDWILGALHLEPEARPSAAELAAELERMLTGRAEQSRRQGEAARLLALARRDLSTYRGLSDRINAEERVATVLRAKVPGHAPVAQKQPAWQAEDRVTTLRQAQESGSLAEQTTHFQKRVVNEVLERCAGYRSKAARELGVSRQWLHRLLARWESE